MEPYSKLLPATSKRQFADVMLQILLAIEEHRNAHSDRSANIWAMCLMRAQAGAILGNFAGTLIDIVRENPLVIGVRSPGKRKIDAFTIGYRLVGDDVEVTVRVLPEAHTIAGAAEIYEDLRRGMNECWPEPVETTTPVVPKRKQMSASNKWLCEEHIDLGTPLHELEAEWLQKRRHEDKDDPQDPNDSMKKVIKAERDRRAKAGGSLGDQ